MMQSLTYDGKRLLQEVTLILSDEPFTDAGKLSVRLLNAVRQFASNHGYTVILDGGRLTVMHMTNVVAGSSNTTDRQ